MAVEEERQPRPNLKIGICGEHGGDPDSVAFFHRAGLDYVSLLALPGAGGAPGARRTRRWPKKGGAGSGTA